MWWWLVLLSVCHRLPSSDKGDSASSHSDCLHWYEDPAHRLVAVPMKTCTTGDRLLLPRPSLWLLSWFTLLLLLRTWSRTSQSSLTNWGPTAPQEPSGSVAPDCDCWGTQPHRLSKCWVVALLGTDDCVLRHPASKTEQLLGSSPAVAVTILTLVDSTCVRVCMYVCVFIHPIGSGSRANSNWCCQLNFPGIRLGCLTNPVLPPFTWFTPPSLCQPPEAIDSQRRHYILVDVRLTLKERSRSLACPL